MLRIRLIHWKASEAAEGARRLRSAGYQVNSEPFDFATFARVLRQNPPSATVIDLSRIPSQGRDVAMAIRSYKTLRQLPLVFADGDPEKVARIKVQLLTPSTPSGSGFAAL